MAIGKDQSITESNSLHFWLLLQIMANSRDCSTAYVSFDGRNQQELRYGDRSVLLLNTIRLSVFSYLHQF